MVTTTTMLCSTSGSVPISTATALIDAMTGLPAIIPIGGAVKSIAVYRDSDNTITSGCTIQLGLVGALSKYIPFASAITTTNLNNLHLAHCNIDLDYGLTADTELRIQLSGAALNLGSIVFEITYCSYA